MNIFPKCLSCLSLYLLIFVSFWSNSAQIQPKNLEGLYEGLHKNIPIGELGGVELSINIAFPQKPSTKPRPVLMLIHGGGFLKGDKSLNNARIQKMTKRGFVAASVMYRLAPKHKFPAAIEDVKLAIRFLKAHAIAYNINPERIIVSGSSSGSYLAVMAGVTGNSGKFSDHGLYPNINSSVHAVAGQSSPIADFTLEKYSHFSLVKRLLEPDSSNQEKLLTAMSPVTYLDKHDPPMFLSHGDADPIVPVDMSREFAQQLENIEHSYEYHEIKGGTHSFNKSARKQAKTVFEAYLKFIDKWAKTD